MNTRMRISLVIMSFDYTCSELINLCICIDIRLSNYGLHFLHPHVLYDSTDTPRFIPDRIIFQLLNITSGIRNDFYLYKLPTYLWERALCVRRSFWASFYLLCRVRHQ